MAMKRFLYIFVCILCIQLPLLAEIDDASLIVSGEAPTKEEATKLALRSAIEQTFGVFVSSNSELKNDELVIDDIATVSSGNIRSFTEISSLSMPSGNVSVTLHVIVSSESIATKYVYGTTSRSSNTSVNFDGAALAKTLEQIDWNRKLMLLRAENTKIAWQHLQKQLEAMVCMKFLDTKLFVSNPTIDGTVNFRVEYYSTELLKEMCSLVWENVKALSLSEDDLSMAKYVGVAIYKQNIVEISFFSYNNSRYATSQDYYFLAPFPVSNFDKIMRCSTFRHYIEDNLAKKYLIPLYSTKTSSSYSFSSRDNILCKTYSDIESSVICIPNFEHTYSYVKVLKEEDLSANTNKKKRQRPQYERKWIFDQTLLKKVEWTENISTYHLTKVNNFSIKNEVIGSINWMRTSTDTIHVTDPTSCKVVVTPFNVNANKFDIIKTHKNEKYEKFIRKISYANLLKPSYKVVYPNGEGCGSQTICCQNCAEYQCNVDTKQLDYDIREYYIDFYVKKPIVLSDKILQDNEFSPCKVVRNKVVVNAYEKTYSDGGRYCLVIRDNNGAHLIFSVRQDPIDEYIRISLKGESNAYLGFEAPGIYNWGAFSYPMN